MLGCVFKLKPFFKNLPSAYPEIGYLMAVFRIHRASMGALRSFFYRLCHHAFVFGRIGVRQISVEPPGRIAY